MTYVSPGCTHKLFVEPIDPKPCDTCKREQDEYHANPY